MKKISIIFLTLSLLLLPFADLEVISVNPVNELIAMLKALIDPDISIIYSIRSGILHTIIFAFCGVSIGVILGTLTAPLNRFRIPRYLFTMARSIHEVFWAFLLLPIVGLTPICGVLAITIPYSATFSKRFYEIYHETDISAYEHLPHCNLIVRYLYGVFPLLKNEIYQFIGYRFECALRSSAVLGFIGLPTLGFYLESYFNEGYYSQAFVILGIFYLIIGSKEYWLKRKLIPLYILLSFVFIPKEINFRIENIIRVFTVDIIPYPFRSTKVGFWEWFYNIIVNEVLPGITNTVVLTQISLTLTAIFGIITLFYINSHIWNKIPHKIFSFITMLIRTTPEYIIAYISVLLFGPSMLPGIIALVLHNSAVVAILTIKNIEVKDFPDDLSNNRINKFSFYILPRLYKTFLGNLFYRWEIMVKESSLLGILGIYTLGFFVDSGISDDKMDKVVVLVFFISLLNIVINSISNRVRNYLKH